MSDNTIELVIKAVDEATQKFESISKSVEGLGEKMEFLGGIFAAVGAAFTLDKIVEAVSGAQFAEAQLDAAFKATGETVGLTREKLDELATSFSRMTVFSDETVKSAESLLLTFNNVRGEAFERTLKVAADLSARFGGDLTDNVRKLGRALQEPAGGFGLLARTVGQLSEAQKDLVASFTDIGDSAGAQNVLLSILEQRLGGAAEAARNTLGGAIQALKNQFEQLFEGTKGGTSSAVEAIQDLTGVLSNPAIKSGIDIIITGLANVAAVAIKAAAALANFFSSGPAATKLGATDQAIANLQKQLEDLTTTRTRAGVTRIQEDPDEVPRYGGRGHTPLNAAALREQIKFLQESRAQLISEQQKTEDATGSPTTGIDLSGIASVAQAATDTLNQATEDSMQKFADKIAVELTHSFLEADIAANKAAQKSADDFQKSVDSAVTASFNAIDKIHAKFDELRDTLQKALSVALLSGTPEEIAKLTKALDDLNARETEQVTAAEKKLGEMSPQAKEAIRNIQNAFASMFGAIDQGISGMARAFLEAIKTMVTNALAADLVKALGLDKAFGGDKSKGDNSSILGTIFSGIVHAFSAGGGQISGPTWVGEDGPELVFPGSSGASVANMRQLQFAAGGGGGGVNYAPNTVLNVTPANGVTPQQLSQVIQLNNQKQRDELFRTMNRNGLGTIRA